MVPAVTHASGIIADGEQALKIARETDQRAAEAFALIFLAFCMGPQGDYARALECAGQGLRIAEEIHHRQWMTAAHCVLGTLYRDLLELPQARQHLEQALQLANETSSFHWIHTATWHLASTYVLANELLQAKTILSGAFDATAPARTLGQRLLWCARAELALAQNDASRALQIVEQLITAWVAWAFQTRYAGRVEGGLQTSRFPRHSDAYHPSAAPPVLSQRVHAFRTRVVRGLTSDASRGERGGT